MRRRRGAAGEAVPGLSPAHGPESCGARLDLSLCALSLCSGPPESRAMARVREIAEATPESEEKL